MGVRKYKDPGAICEKALELIEQGESVVGLSRIKGMPSARLIDDWLSAEEYAPRYARAKEMRSNRIFEEIIEISDTLDPDRDTAAQRLQIDARKWAISKMHPKKYGDRLDVNATVASTVVLNPDADEL